MAERIAITGASGFLGRFGCADLAARGFTIRAISRAVTQTGAERRHVPDLTDASAVRDALRDCDTVVHLAGLAHRRSRAGAAIEAEFQRANVRVTRVVCEEAGRLGAATVIVMSSAAAAGLEADDPDQQVPRVDNAYARTKLAAERAAREAMASSSTRLLIFRPPMIYGPGMKGNPRRLFQLVDAEIPLPLAGVRNQRSMLFVGNLFAAIAATLTTDQESAGPLYPTDGPPISTPDFIHKVAAALGRRPRLFDVPPGVLRAAGRAADLIGGVLPALPGRDDIERLTESFVVSDSRLRTLFSYQPPYSVDAGLEVTAKWWRTSVRPA